MGRFGTAKEGTNVRATPETTEFSETQLATQRNLYVAIPEPIKRANGIANENDIPKNPEEQKKLMRSAIEYAEVPTPHREFIFLKLTNNVTEKEDKVIAGYVQSRGEVTKLPSDEQNVYLAFLDTAFADLMGAIQRGDTAAAKTESSLFSMENQVIAMNSTLLAAGYSDKEILRFDSQLHDAMVTRRDEAMQEGKKKGLTGVGLESYANSEAQKAGTEFVAESPMYQNLLRKDPAAAQEFRAQAEIAFGKGSMADNAYDANQEAWNALKATSTKQEVRQVASEYSLANPVELGNLFGFISDVFASAESGVTVASGAEAGAAAQAQAMDAIFKQKEADQMKKEMDEMLEELKALNEKDTVEEADLSPETKDMLEKMGIEKEDTIKEAIERVETIIANVELQNEKVEELQEGFRGKNWPEGMPPMHPDPEDVLEKNGIMKDGELTELGKEVMPELLKESAADFMQACDTILFRIEIVGNEELMDKLNEAKRDVENYMVNPESVERLERFNEVMQDPEIVAVHAAFFEAIAENAGEVISNRAQEEE